MGELKIQIGEVVIAPDDRIWVLDSIHEDMQNNAKLKNGGTFCFWPLSSLQAVDRASDVSDKLSQQLAESQAESGKLRKILSALYCSIDSGELESNKRALKCQIHALLSKDGES
jgi:hypothetical protein